MSVIAPSEYLSLTSENSSLSFVTRNVSLTPVIGTSCSTVSPSISTRSISYAVSMTVDLPEGNPSARKARKSCVVLLLSISYATCALSPAYVTEITYLLAFLILFQLNTPAAESATLLNSASPVSGVSGTSGLSGLSGLFGSSGPSGLSSLSTR